MSVQRIKPTSDLAMKKVLASEENKDVLSGLINDFFDIEAKPEEITIENPYSIESYKEYVEGKEKRVLRQTVRDITATLTRADFVSELQIRRTAFFDERVLYYIFERFIKNYNKPGRMVLDSEGKPNRYSSLVPMYSLNIIGYNHYTEDDDALRILKLYDPKRNKGYKKDLINIGFFELSKGKIETENQRHWRDYFMTGEASPDAPGYIKRACRIIELESMSEEEQRMATIYEQADEAWENDVSGAYFAGLFEGEEKGITVGREQGITVGREQGITVGREQGITVGMEQGITVGREQGITVGMEQGITVGREQGITAGRAEGELEFAKLLLNNGMDPALLLKFAENIPVVKKLIRENQ